MNVLIVEDELLAANRLEELIASVASELTIVKKTDSIESTVKYLKTSPALDVIFMDIQLGDGISFSIFEEIKVDTPVIFTTAYDKYSIDAFKVHSVDYLLKPIEVDALAVAIEKFKKYYTQNKTGISEQIIRMFNSLPQQKFKERILIKKGQTFDYKKTADVAFLFAEGKLCFGMDFSNQKFMLDQTLQELEPQLHPDQFFRINRHLIINIESVQKVHTWFGNRLKIDTKIPTTLETLVSRERVNDFKKWLGK